MNKKVGSTIMFETPSVIISSASIVGPKEGEGPLKEYFDKVLTDTLLGETSWEKAESKLFTKGVNMAIQKAGLNMNNIDYIFAGDLLNQCVSSTFGLRDTNVPMFGLFGACSTIGEGMGLGAMVLDGGFAEKVIVSASSHFCSAEKQFRFPLNFGTQRPPSASWTVTGNGSVILAKTGDGPIITHATTGRIIDMGIKDANNMGAAMAPAAVDTLVNHFKDTGRKPDYYDVIATGDLGHIGHELVIKLMKQEGYTLGSNYTDCGIEIFDKNTQDTHAGGSGCACSATTFCGYYMEKLKNNEIKNILFIPTGALLSPTSTQQKESIPSIAHAVAIEGR